MNWFANQRQDFITDMLHVYGFINRTHLMRKYNISNAQAAIDFKAYNLKHPNAMKYDKHQRAYTRINHD